MKAEKIKHNRYPDFVQILILAIMVIIVIGFITWQVYLTNSPQKDNPTFNSKVPSFVKYCEDIGTFESNNFQFNFRCPKSLVFFECPNDINFYSIQDIQAIDKFYKIENLCRERQGIIQIMRSQSSLYRTDKKSNSDFEVKEEEILVDRIKATRQYVKYEGANVPSYSEFVTFQKNNRYYRLRLLDAKLLPQFDQILSTFKFIETSEEKSNYSELLQKAEDKGRVSVVVDLNVPFTSEPELTAEEVKRQRESIEKAQEKIIDELTEYEAQVTYRYKIFPSMAIAVDKEALDLLVKSELVKNIREDRPQ